MSHRCRFTPARRSFPWEALSRFCVFLTEDRLQTPQQISPGHVARYVEALGREAKPATVRQHMAALRGLFSWLIAVFLLLFDLRPVDATRRSWLVTNFVCARTNMHEPHTAISSLGPPGGEP